MIDPTRISPLGLAGLSVLAFLSAGAAWGAPRPPAPQQEPLSSLVNIRFQNDIRVFTVMAAVNAAGFDRESPGREMSDVRLAVRQILAGLDSDLLSRLRRFYERSLLEINREQAQAAYTSLSLLLSGPPDFKLAADPATLPADVQQVKGFEELAAEVYRVGRLQELWDRLRPRYERELIAYQPILRSIVHDTLAYFRVPARIVLDRQIILTADLLDVKDLVNARNLEKVYHIVVGPSDNPENNRHQLEHEYLHFLVDPLAAKYGPSIARHEKLLDLAQRQPQIRSEHQNRFQLVVVESLIESLQLRLRPRESEAAHRQRLAALFRRGLIFAPYFDRGLANYENSEFVPLPAYLETLFLGIGDSAIREDEKAVAAWEEESRKEDERGQAAAAAAQRQARLSQLFEEASALLSQNQDAAAEAKLGEILELDPEYGNAHFYLGQIALRRRELDRALSHFQRSADSTAVQPRVRARSLLGMARIFAHRGQFGEARELFEKVSAMAGDLDGAQVEAADALSKLPPPER